jgi:hypothetical protein
MYKNTSKYIIVELIRILSNRVVYYSKIIVLTFINRNQYKRL